VIENPRRVVSRRRKIEGLRVLQSCGFLWMFDGGARRFCRMPRHTPVSPDAPMAWASYERLEIDESRSCFLVVLDDAGTRIVRVWLHAEPCDRCRPERETSEGVP
jgi:hypothetical protein